MQIRLLAPILLAGALGLAACGGGGSGSSDATVPADADLVVKALDGLKWDASSYSVAAGSVVIAADNESSQPHNFHLAAEDGTELKPVLDLPSKGTIASGTYQLAAGTYTAFCSIPGHANMRATITVAG